MKLLVWAQTQPVSPSLAVTKERANLKASSMTGGWVSSGVI
jgi:hypothetical protein